MEVNSNFQRRLKRQVDRVETVKDDLEVLELIANSRNQKKVEEANTNLRRKLIRHIGTLCKILHLKTQKIQMGTHHRETKYITNNKRMVWF